mmetsp:Transcript_20827/g.43050  ORF Transcript_20827/g.43050 Transcript_20827/m.43050 type:complete len:927 (-) Transcript_20827:3882-6662(-)
MVGYGDSLSKSRRSGWEAAYLDYEGLKEIRHQLEALLVKRDQDIAASLSFQPGSYIEVDGDGLQKYRELTEKFAFKLHNEIEKVSLFSLARMGELADAVGALRFKKSLGLASSSCSDLNDAPGDVENASGYNFDEFGERASLLPSLGRKSYSRKRSSNPSAQNLFSKEKLETIVGAKIGPESDEIGFYSDVGVELIHLLKFTCLNAVGIRKIVKKYEKLLVLFPVTKEVQNAINMPHEVMKDGHAVLMPNEVARHFSAAHDDRLRQLSNNQSFSTIYASLLDALAGFERSFCGTLELCENISKSSAISFLKGSRNIPLLRFECTIASIHALMEFAKDVSRPFQVFLSRKAMIGTGKDRGDMGSADKIAVNLLLAFDPDFILDLSERELCDWYRRATGKEKPGKQATHKKTASFVDFTVGEDLKKWGGADAISMNINLMSTLLYTVGYYIVAPTANHYAILLGHDGAYGATLIGSTSFSALFAAFIYSAWSRKSFWSALTFSALCPFVGNLMYAIAITYDSMAMALFGRVLCGFGSAEVVNRQFISSCVSYVNMTKASALFVSVSAVGMSIGPLIAALLDMSAGRDADVDIPIHLPGSPKQSGIVFNHVTMPGFLMAFLWGLQLLSLIFLFREPERINSETDNTKKVEVGEGLDQKSRSYGTVVSDPDLCDSSSSEKKSLRNEVVSVCKIIFSNPTFLVTLYLFAFIELVAEILISSCSMIVRRYFGWHGSKAGFMIASLGALVLPAHFIVERESRFYSERRILKASIIFTFGAILLICNYEGLVLDCVGQTMKHVESRNEMVKRLKSILKHSSKHGEFPYDWGAGVFVYIIALSAIFIGSIIMEGVNTSLMSKAVPRELNDSFINMGLLATLVGTLGRVIGDSMITLSAFVGRSPLYDFVSVTYLPLTPVILFGLYLVNRYYKLFV